jgi:hypothetical protein
MGKPIPLKATPYGSYTEPTYNWYSVPEGFESTEQNPEATAEFSATYFVEMLDDGITYTDSVAVTVLPLPEVDLGQDTAFCGGTTVVLDAGADGWRYLWSTGDTTRTIEVDSASFGDYGEQSYSVTVHNEFGCFKQDTIMLEFRNCTSIDEVANISLNVYPNPNNGAFTLELAALEDDVVNISIYNQAGSVVYTRENFEVRGNERLNIDLGGKASGIYQLFVKGKNSRVQKKIVAY